MKEFTDKEILDFAKKNLTLIRNDVGETQLSRVRCNVNTVDGDVGAVGGSVGTVDGNVRVVRGKTNQGE